MTIQIILVIFLIILLVYIVFLHIHLAKKNIFIESALRNLAGIEKSRSMEEVMAFLQEIHKLDQYSSLFTEKLLGDSTMNFILENHKELRIFMHYTKDEHDARSILKDGFKFIDSFYKTALPVSNDKLDLVVKHNRRKFFGDYLIIICISNDIVNYYSLELEKAGIKDYSFENILTDTPPSGSDNSELIYQLSSQFIKGYINHRTGEIVRNPGYDPWYNSPQFIKNVGLLRNK